MVKNCTTLLDALHGNICAHILAKCVKHLLSENAANECNPKIHFIEFFKILGMYSYQICMV